MRAVNEADLRRMRDALFFEGPQSRHRWTRFWGLLLLAAVITTAGVISDSTATVIGAMIVAPLMTPILGIVLAVAIGDRENLLRSIGIVVVGAAAVVLLGWLIGLITPVDVAAGNIQIAGRVSPRTVDLFAALATGAVGAFALVRSDVSDTLPGVAIAISLVPPLTVAGLTLEAGQTDQARGALLLFLTNVAAILVTGIVVMAAYRVRRAALDTPTPSGARAFGTRYPVIVIVAFVVIVAVPLVISGRRYAASTLTTDHVASIARQWASPAGWEVVSAEYRDGAIVVRADGPEPAPSAAKLRSLLDAGDERGTTVRLELVPVQRVDLPGR